MNRRGDIPMILLFVIALVLVVISLLSFASFKMRFVDNSEGRSEILKEIGFYEDYITRESGIIGKEIISKGGLLLSDEGLKERFKEILKNRGFEIKGLDNYYGKILRWEKVSFVRDSDKYIFEMRDLRLEASRGANKMSRNFGFKIEFDGKGEITRTSISEMNSNTLE